MAVGDMFLKMQGVTGETTDSSHKDEMDVVSWRWGMSRTQAGSISSPGMQSTVRYSVIELVRRVDRATPTLMGFLRTNKVCPKARLTVRKAGSDPLEYFVIDLDNVMVIDLKVHSPEGSTEELMENLSLSFNKLKITYKPQGRTGGAGGGDSIFEVDTVVG